MARTNYEIIADEYYDPRHITSRNFDSATLAYCERKKLLHVLPDDGLILELGAGRGNVGRYCKIEFDRVVQTDIAHNMLRIQPREKATAVIQCNALQLPFQVSLFSAIVAFLYDPFNKPSFYFQINDILKSGGVFVGTLPHLIWGQTLRKVVGYNLNKTKFTRFLSPTKESVEMESFLMNDEEITKALNKANFDLIELFDLNLPLAVKVISPHIQIPADLLGISPYELPIVKLIIARKAK